MFFVTQNRKTAFLRCFLKKKENKSSILVYI